MEIQQETTPEISQPKPWGFWATFGLGFAIFLGYSIVQGIVHGIISILTFDANPLIDIEAFIKSLETNGLAISVSTIVAFPVGIFLTIVFIRLRKTFAIREYLVFRIIPWKTALLALAIPVGLGLIIGIAGSYVIKTNSPGIMEQAYANSTLPALFWIAVVIFAPVFEEILFRGFVFTGFAQSPLRSGGAVILTSLIWAVLHIQYDWFGMITILIIGIVLGIVRIKTRSLWGPILIHSVWNLLQMVALTVWQQSI